MPLTDYAMIIESVSQMPSQLPQLSFVLSLTISALLAVHRCEAQGPHVEAEFFNRLNLTGWVGEMECWSVRDGVIAGHCDDELPNNKFLWSDVEVGDFYLSVDVRMPQDDRNAGIQFRSTRTPTKNLQAVGYQADAGKNVWGRLYHEEGRGKLDWTGRGEAAVKPGNWNRYEILAVGHHIWTAINGTLSVAVHDPGGELRGHIALQIHSGQPQTVEYRINELVHDPDVALAGMTKEQLVAAARTIERRPNVVLIFADDQGYGDLGCFGSTTIRTPYIDRLASKGRKFTSFMVPQSLCTPSRASLLTGCYPKRVDMDDWVLVPQSEKGLHPDEHTIADQLKSNGYATACFGKWHLGHHADTLPRRLGFDRYLGIPYSNDMNHPKNQGKPPMNVEGLDRLWKNPESTLTEWQTPLIENETIVELPVDQRTVTRRYTDKAIGFIEENQHKPFFLYLPHSMPHVPLYVPEDAYDADPKRAYVAAIEHIDAEVGRLLETLRELNLDENTYVIYTSDNGPSLGKQHHAGSAGPLRGGKVSTFEGGTRVPFVIRGPGVPAGSECDELVATMDILPTLAAVTNTELPSVNKIDGLDVSALLTDDEAESPRDELLYYSGHGVLEGLRQGVWKLLVKQRDNKPVEVMLFDLSRDLGEKQNVANDHPNVVKRLTTRMNELGDEVETNARQPWRVGEKSGRPNPRNEPVIFNGNDLSGWEGDRRFWSVREGSIVGKGDGDVTKNQFLWSSVEVADFYLSVDVRLRPNTTDAGIQFRSRRRSDDDLAAIGYQADIGEGSWGRIWHENGRGVIDWNGRGEKAIKPGDWNRYEILAVGHRIWTAINGKLAVAKHDPEGELRGRIALQLNAGRAKSVEYRIGKLIHDPQVKLAGFTKEQLINATGVIPKATSELNFDDGETLGVTTGDVSLVSSEVGGRALTLARGGASVSYEMSPEWQVGNGPFSLSVWVKPSELRQAGILCAGGYQFRHGWLLDCHPNGSVRLETSGPSDQRNGTVQTTGGALTVAQWTHIGVTVDRDRMATIFINGKQRAAGKIGTADLTNPDALLVVGAIENRLAASFVGAIDGIAVWKRSLSAVELQQLASGQDVQAMLPPSVGRFAGSPSDAVAKTKFDDDGFRLESGETVVFLGGANMVRSRLDGTLEAALSVKFAEQQPRFRNMAWEGDTVYEQWRDIDFGSWTDQLAGVNATTLIIDFGQMESLEGRSRLGDFVAAYETLLEEMQQTTERVVLLTPRPFEKPVSAHMPDHSVKNADVKAYADAVRELAERRGFICVDLFTPLLGSRTRLTTNGVHLKAASQSHVAALIAKALGIPAAGDDESLSTAICEKNRLWYDNWRPMNWSFAFGDRTQQPFGQPFNDHPPLKTELAAFKPLIQNVDRQIHVIARAIAGGQSVPKFQPVAAALTAPEETIDPAEHTSEAELATFTVIPLISWYVFK